VYVGDFFQGRVQVLAVEDRTQVPEPTAVLGLLGLGFTVTRLRKNRSSINLVKRLQKS
jgi:hypothetical protein